MLRRPRDRALVAGLLVAYVVALALIAFWPTHVDEGAGPLLAAIRRVLPWATYPRIEFVANIALFAPFGLLLTLLMRPWPWVLGAGVAASAAIELVQAVALPGRTATAWDVIANSLGTVAGIAIALVWAAARAQARAAAR